jgi:hypothetical protein
MHVMIHSLLSCWQRNGDYARKLVADVPEDRFTHQPAAGMNHPAWVLVHLAGYHDTLVKLIRGESFDDPKGQRFGMQSKPEADLSVYGRKSSLIAEYERGHTAVADAIRAMDPARLDDPTPLERWIPIMPTVGMVLTYVMLVHPSTHLGQLSAWRRVQGMPAV